MMGSGRGKARRVQTQQPELIVVDERIGNTRFSALEARAQGPLRSARLVQIVTTHPQTDASMARGFSPKFCLQMTITASEAAMRQARAHQLVEIDYVREGGGFHVVYGKAGFQDVLARVLPNTPGLHTLPDHAADAEYWWSQREGMLYACATESKLEDQRPLMNISDGHDILRCLDRMDELVSEFSEHGEELSVLLVPENQVEKVT